MARKLCNNPQSNRSWYCHSAQCNRRRQCHSDGCPGPSQPGTSWSSSIQHTASSQLDSRSVPLGTRGHCTLCRPGRSGCRQGNRRRRSHRTPARGRGTAPRRDFRRRTGCPGTRRRDTRRHSRRHRCMGSHYPRGTGHLSRLRPQRTPFHSRRSSGDQSGCQRRGRRTRYRQDQRRRMCHQGRSDRRSTPGRSRRSAPRHSADRRICPHSESGQRGTSRHRYWYRPH